MRGPFLRSLKRILFAIVLPSAALALLVAEAAFAQEFRPPPLEIPIPNVSLTNITRGSYFVNGTEVQFADIPWLSQYITGAYQWAVGVASLMAGVMFMVGAFQYLTSAGDSGRVSKAKQRITDAIIGLLLVLGAYVLLYTINPDLITVQSIRIQAVPRTTLQVIPASQIQAVTGQPPASRSEMMSRAMEAAAAKGGRDFACFVRASMEHESGGRPDVIGHDENANTTVFSVGARRRFINSGKKYSGATFPPAGCNDKSCQNRGPLNDDNRSADVTRPPDYGLDWNYSHGIGSGQSTIFPGNAPCPGKDGLGRGFRRGSNCYTVQDLLDTNKQIEAMVDHYWACWSGRGGRGSNVAAGYVCYAGTIAPDNPIIVSRINSYNRCRGGG